MAKEKIIVTPTEKDLNTRGVKLYDKDKIVVVETESDTLTKGL